MKDGQDDTDYITDGSIAAVSSSPFVETLREKGSEAMYVVDPNGEFWQLKGFDGEELKSTSKEGLDPVVTPTACIMAELCREFRLRTNQVMSVESKAHCASSSVTQLCV